RDVHRTGELDSRLEVEAFEHAVASNVCADDRRDAGILEAPRQIERAHLACLSPALDRHLATARVDADGDTAGEIARRLAHQVRIAHRRSAEDHPVDALVEPGDHGIEVADTAAELHRDTHRSEDCLDSGSVDRLPGEGAVEV